MNCAQTELYKKLNILQMNTHINFYSKHFTLQYKKAKKVAKYVHQKFMIS
jgi:hypothetical protein